MRWTTILATLVLLAIGGTASRLCAEGADAFWQAMREPGAVAIMRHAIAPGTGDPANFTLGDCSTQRNLDRRGRDQARAIGRAIREHGIAVDRVLTSQWCRSRETAELLDLASVEDLPALNSFFEARSRRAEQTAATRRFLADRTDAETLVLVSHQVNVTALTGVYPRSGEVVAIEVAEDGEVAVRGRVLIAAPAAGS